MAAKATWTDAGPGRPPQGRASALDLDLLEEMVSRSYAILTRGTFGRRAAEG